MILVLSAPEDPHARAVLDSCAALGVAAEWLDPSRFPGRDRLSMDVRGTGEPRITWSGDQAPDLERCGAVWWRRPQAFDLDPTIRDAAARHFAEAECREALDGLWQSLDAFWVNDPLRAAAAQRPAYPLAVASRLGLPVPETLMTNDPEAAGDFCARHAAGVVFKGFSATVDAPRIVGPADLERLNTVRHAPVIFQAVVPGVDIRAIVVGDRVFAGALDARDREFAGAEAPMAPVRLPVPVATRLKRLMRSLGLDYGAIDLRRTDAGDHVFLGIDPAGAWLTVEETTGLPISRSLAEHLAAGDRKATTRRPKGRLFQRVTLSRTVRSRAPAFP